MGYGALLAGAGFLGWSQVNSLPALCAAWAVPGASMAMTLYEPAFNVLTKRFPTRYLRGITVLKPVGGFASTPSLPAPAGLLALFDCRGALAAIGGVLIFGVAPMDAWALRGTPQRTVTTAVHDRVSAKAEGKDDQKADDATLHQALREPSFCC